MLWPVEPGLSARTIRVRLWTVTDGKAGDRRQTECLVSALADARAGMGATVPEHRDWVIDRTAWANFAAPQGQCLAFWALPAEARAAWRSAPPALVIGCGRRAAAVVAALKARRAREIARLQRISGRVAPGSPDAGPDSGDAALIAVQIHDPRANRQRYDLIVLPAHDLVSGANVLSLLGPPLHFSDAERAAIAGRWAALGTEPGRKIAVLVGGNSRARRLTSARVALLVRRLQALDQQGFRLWIALSRRTPRKAADMLRAFAAARAIRIVGPGSPAPENPYLGFLSFAEAAIVTDDSVNMACEAASFRLPVHVFALEGRSSKFDRFHAALRAHGAARPFDGEIGHWTFPPLREGARAAAEILRRLAGRE